MRRIGKLVLVAGLAAPVAAVAEDAYIRVEARRAGLAEAVASWQQGFSNVVTFPSGQTWTAIALGPFDEEQARSLMAQWKREGKIPGDSMLALASEVSSVEAHGGSGPEPAAPAEEQAEAPASPGRGSLIQEGRTNLLEGDRTSNSRSGNSGSGATRDDLNIQSVTDGVAVPDVAPGETAETGPYTGEANVNSFAEPDVAPPAMATLDDVPATEERQPGGPMFGEGGDGGPSASLSGMPAPEGATAAGADTDEAENPAPVIAPDGIYLRIEALPGRTQGDAALARWRETLPEAGMWQLPNGWFVITLGPVEAAQATQFRDVLQTAGRIPADTMISQSGALGTPVVAGSAPAMPELPPEPVEMPPLAEVQDTLKWAGFYSGEVDGQSGPQTREAIANAIAGLELAADPGAAMRDLIEQRAGWRDAMGLEILQDAHTGLSLNAPVSRLDFVRSERALSIYGPKDGSGAALILFSAPGGQQELQDLMGLVTALGWVPRPERVVERGHLALKGQDDKHIGQAEGWVRDGRADGFVLIWPEADALNQPRMAAEIRDSFDRFAEPQQPAAGE